MQFYFVKIISHCKQHFLIPMTYLLGRTSLLSRWMGLFHGAPPFPCWLLLRLLRRQDPVQSTWGLMQGFLWDTLPEVGLLGHGEHILRFSRGLLHPFRGEPCGQHPSLTLKACTLKAWPALSPGRWAEHEACLTLSHTLPCAGHSGKWGNLKGRDKGRSPSSSHGRSIYSWGV